METQWYAFENFQKNGNFSNSSDRREDPFGKKEKDKSEQKAELLAILHLAFTGELRTDMDL
jgi:hypothetical protein